MDGQDENWKIWKDFIIFPPVSNKLNKLICYFEFTPYNPFGGRKQLLYGHTAPLPSSFQKSARSHCPPPPPSKKSAKNKR